MSYGVELSNCYYVHTKHETFINTYTCDIDIDISTSYLGPKIDVVFSIKCSVFVFTKYIYLLVLLAVGKFISTISHNIVFDSVQIQ